LEIKTLTEYGVYNWDNKAYLITNKNESILIEPVIPYDEVKDENLKAVFITHCHYDHISFLDTYLNKGLKFVMSEKTFKYLKDPAINASRGNLEEEIVMDLSGEDLFLIDKDLEFSLIGLKIKAILTPGHTKDSTSYLIEKNLFSGDFLFKRSIGRMDLASGSESDMKKSINKIVTYDIETIYPGHGRDTSLDYELRNNSFIKRFLND